MLLEAALYVADKLGVESIVLQIKGVSPTQSQSSGVVFFSLQEQGASLLGALGRY